MIIGLSNTDFKLILLNHRRGKKTFVLPINKGRTSLFENHVQL